MIIIFIFVIIFIEENKNKAEKARVNDWREVRRREEQ